MTVRSSSDGSDRDACEAQRTRSARLREERRWRRPPVELTWHDGGRRPLQPKEHNLPGWPEGVLLVGSGETWSHVTLDQSLIEPVCQACVLPGILRDTFPERGGKSRLLFSNPASTGRQMMTVRLSCDEGETWPVAKLIYPGSAAYSCMTVPADASIGLLDERDGHRTIAVARFDLPRADRRPRQAGRASRARAGQLSRGPTKPPPTAEGALLRAGPFATN